MVVKNSIHRILWITFSENKQTNLSNFFNYCKKNVKWRMECLNLGSLCLPCCVPYTRYKAWSWFYLLTSNPQVNEAESIMLWRFVCKNHIDLVYGTHTLTLQIICEIISSILSVKKKTNSVLFFLFYQKYRFLFCSLIKIANQETKN